MTTSRALYTFGVRVGDDTFEEIDVYADSDESALQQAKAEAADLYGPGRELSPMQPGGSGGLVYFQENVR